MKRLIFIFCILSSFEVHSQLVTITEIQGGTAASPYAETTVTTKGAVTGSYSDGYFIRENSIEWGGIYVYDPSRTPKPEIGDTVQITGLVTEYYNWTEIKNITDYTIVSTDNPIPEPVILTADEISEGWESCLIKIEDAVCTNTNLGYGEWEVNDGYTSLVVDDMGISYSPTLNQEYNITGNLSYTFSVFKIEPRDADDIEILAPVYFTSDLQPVSFNTSEIHLNWETNTSSTTEVVYGLSPELELGQLSAAAGISHDIVISGLDPASVIYVRAFSVLDTDTAKSDILAFATQSESSGEIKVYFNHTPTSLNYSQYPELITGSLEDTIIKFINKARYTLDMALYDFTTHSSGASEYNNGIITAISEAEVRGVAVRLITDAAVSDAAPSSVSRLEVDHDGIMHHKFIIVDHEKADSSWVITGSTNPNYNNLYLDFNNLITIQDQSLAKAYLIEFEEIWGGSGSSPYPAKSLSGNQKSDNSPHHFLIGGKEVELYFSPSDQTTKHIEEELLNAGTSIDFAVMAFTENSLGDALVAAYQQNIYVKGIIDYVEYSGSEYNYLLGKGINILDYVNPDGSSWPDGSTLHHKFAVIDAGTDNGTVITGSHNWTASAESINDENTLIIRDSDIATYFSIEAERIRNWLLNPPVKPDAVDDTYDLFTEDPLVLAVTSNDNIEGDFILSVTSDGPNYGSYTIVEDTVIHYFMNNDASNEYDTMFYCISLTDYEPFKDTAMVVIHKIPITVKKKQIEDLVQIYPNPATDRILIAFNNKIPGRKFFQLRNIVGQLIITEEIESCSAPIEISLDYIKSGIYIIDIQTDIGNLSKRIIKK